MSKYVRKYVQSARAGDIDISIAFYADTPAKNYRIYYCGSDTGRRYDYLGAAERELIKIVQKQRENGITGHVYNYCTRDDIPRRGSNA
jgi:hypothetical protein